MEYREPWRIIDSTCSSPFRSVFKFPRLPKKSERNTWKSVLTVSQGLSWAFFVSVLQLSLRLKLSVKVLCVLAEWRKLMVFIAYIATLSYFKALDRSFQTASKGNKSITIFNWCWKLSLPSSNLVRIVLIVWFILPWQWRFDHRNFVFTILNIIIERDSHGVSLWSR